MRYRFVDCRWSLDDRSWGRAQYLDGHIPGAVFVDVEHDLAAPAGAGGRHPLPDAADFARIAGSAGIAAGVFVVAYGSLGGAERLWWLLRHFGHDDCAVIDLDAWHGPITRLEESVETAAFMPVERKDDTVGVAELATRHAELVLVDTRLPSRWRGEENLIDKRPGRLPGALNAPWNEPLPELPPGELVAYCGSGITACVVLHRLHLGGRDGRLYPGSWSEWEQDENLPCESG